MPRNIEEAALYVERKIAALADLDLTRDSDAAEARRLFQRVHAVEQYVGIDWGTYNPDLED